jgi:hypothetical protein
MSDHIEEAYASRGLVHRPLFPWFLLGASLARSVESLARSAELGVYAYRASKGIATSVPPRRP